MILNLQGNALVSISAEEPLLLDLEVTVPDQHPVMTIRTAKVSESCDFSGKAPSLRSTPSHSTLKPRITLKYTP